MTARAPRLALVALVSPSIAAPSGPVRAYTAVDLVAGDGTVIAGRNSKPGDALRSLGGGR